MTLWIRLWTALRSASSTLVLAVVWITVLTPLGLVSRSLRSDPLQRSFDPGLPSYWADRDDPGSEARPDGASEGVVGFLVARGKPWMVPVVLVLLAVGSLVVLSEGSAVFVLLYPLF